MFDNIRNSRTFKNISITGFGVALAQLCTILSMPLVAKLCGVEEFGEFNFYVSIATVLVVLNSLRIETLFFVVQDELIEKLAIFFRFFFFHSVALSFLIIVIISQLYFDDFTVYVCVVAFLVYCIGIFEFNLQYNVRIGFFKKNAKMRVCRAVIFPILCLFAYFLSILDAKTVLLSLAFSNAIPVLFFEKKRLIVSDFKWKSKYYEIFCKEIKKAASFQVPASFARTISLSIVILMAGYLSIPEVGFFSLALKMLIAPASIFILAVSDVFKRTLVTNKHEALRLYHNIALFGVLISFASILVVFLFGRFILNLLMGSEWVGTVDYMIALAPYFTAIVVFSPITHVYLVENKQNLDLYWQFYNLFSLCIVTFLGLQQSLLQATYFFSWVAAFNLCVSAVYCYSVLKSRG